MLVLTQRWARGFLWSYLAHDKCMQGGEGHSKENEMSTLWAGKVKFSPKNQGCLFLRESREKGGVGMGV